MISRLAAAAILAAGLVFGHAAQADPENTLIITLDSGEVRIALRPDLAPNHVERIKTLAREGQYDNVAFHRVMEGFMAQTGDVEFGDMEDGFDPQRAGTGGSSLPNLTREFSTLPFERGVVGMARSSDKDSANSQFFITYARSEWLDNDYTIVGMVESGMEYVDAIRRGVGQSGVVPEPDRMLSVRVEADAR